MGGGAVRRPWRDGLARDRRQVAGHDRPLARRDPRQYASAPRLAVRNPGSLAAHGVDSDLAPRASGHLDLRLGLPPPDDVNVDVGGVSCDIVYYDAKLIVMLDGAGNHRSRGQVRRDLADAFELHKAGWLVFRYGEAEIYGQPAAVVAEVLAALASRAGMGGATSGS
jgi:hypothetical protein